VRVLFFEVAAMPPWPVLRRIHVIAASMGGVIVLYTR
jgi:alpha-beta hydrolase superfamily lysophospholipase